MFQGYFTHYVDKSPVSVTSWYDPAQSYMINHTSYVYRDGFYVESKQSRKLNYEHAQPELSIQKNCIAAITDHHRYSYPWVTIACDEVYDVTFICQRSQPPSTVPGIILTDRTCEENWITLEGSESCFLIVPDIKSKISFYESTQLCTLRNASLFKAAISDEIYTTWKERELKMHFKHGLYTLFSDDIPEVHEALLDTDLALLINIVFGRHVAQNSLHNIFLQMLWWSGIERRNYMAYFTHFNQSCAIVTFSMTSFYYDDTSHQTRGWGVKCRPCDEPIHVSGVICEKPSKKNNITCVRKQFECHD